MAVKRVAKDFSGGLVPAWADSFPHGWVLPVMLLTSKTPTRYTIFVKTCTTVRMVDHSV